MVNVSIVGAKGYVGEELLRILCSHPEVKITGIYDLMEGKKVSIKDMYPALKKVGGLQCEDADTEKMAFTPTFFMAQMLAL